MNISAWKRRKDITMLHTTELYYFSPTGGTKKVGEIFCSGISETVKAVNLAVRNEPVTPPSSQVTVVAVPVFGGRIPSVAAEKLAQLNGTGKQAVALTVYGNRAYEDALLELGTVLEKSGFQVVAAAALVAQHSMAPEVGKGRPDEQDKAEILAFAEKALAKLAQGTTNSVQIPGNFPYKAAMNMPVTPISLSSCTKCGKCTAVCPTNAIRIENDSIVTSPEKCILCMACVADCPEHARILPPPLQEKMEQMLGALKSVRNPNEYFL